MIIFTFLFLYKKIIFFLFFRFRLYLKGYLVKFFVYITFICFLKHNFKPY